MTVRQLLLATLAGTAITGAAQAEVYITGDNGSSDRVHQTATEAEQRWQADGRVIVRATGKGGLADYVGFGEDVALSEAVSLVKPSGWVVHYSAGVDRDKLVSWDVDDGIWVDGLYEIMRDAEYDASVAIDDQRIRVRERPDDAASDTKSGYAEVVTGTDDTAETSTETAEAAMDDDRTSGDADQADASAASTGDTESAENTETASADASPEGNTETASADASQADETPAAEADPATVTLSLSAGESLRDQLMAFAEASGWQLDWDVDTDFTVGFDATASGAYINVIEQVMRAINNRNAETFTATTYGNQVVRITNK